MSDPYYSNSSNRFAFHNDLAHLLKFPVVTWLYGHTHYANKFNINGVTITTNQLGYIREEPYIKYNPYAYLDLDKLSK